MIFGAGGRKQDGQPTSVSKFNSNSGIQEGEQSSVALVRICIPYTINEAL
jgi:hypothetical protein